MIARLADDDAVRAFADMVLDRDGTASREPGCVDNDGGSTAVQGATRRLLARLADDGILAAQVREAAVALVKIDAAGAVETRAAHLPIVPDEQARPYRATASRIVTRGDPAPVEPPGFALDPGSVLDLVPAGAATGWNLSRAAGTPSIDAPTGQAPRPGSGTVRPTTAAGGPFWPIGRPRRRPSVCRTRTTSRCDARGVRGRRQTARPALPSPTPAIGHLAASRKRGMSNIARRPPAAMGLAEQPTTVGGPGRCRPTAPAS